jgi:hypothetical protein
MRAPPAASANWRGIRFGQRPLFQGKEVWPRAVGAKRKLHLLQVYDGMLDPLPQAWL